MRCPRCGSENERDVSKSPCTRCGLLVKMPERSNNKDIQSTLWQTASDVRAAQNPPTSQVSASFSPSPQTPLPHSEQYPFLTQPRFQSLPIQPTGSIVPYPMASPQASKQTIKQPISPPSKTGRTTEELFVNDQQSGYSSLSAEPSDAQFFAEPFRQMKTPVPQLFQKLEDAPSHAEEIFSSPHVLLTPGMLLRDGRYRLKERWSHQEWQRDVYEAAWLAQDAQRGGAQVVICELSIPGSASISMQAMLRTATIALTSIGRHPHVPMLWDAFSDIGKSFFVFEPIVGEALAEQMRRTGRAIPERDVVEMGLQILDILDAASQQMPPLVHGLIGPSHIIANNARSWYALTNFSIVLAGRAIQLVAAIDTVHRSPYFSPEFVKGEIDTRSDLYALVATMYHTVTGSVPDETNGRIPEAIRLNPTISSALNAVLAKGLHSMPLNRFQTPSELRQALLTLHEYKDAPRIRTDVLQRLSRPVPIQSLLSTQQAPAVLPGSIASEKKARRTPAPNVSDMVMDDGHNTNRLALAFIVGILLCLLVVLILWYFLR